MSGEDEAFDLQSLPKSALGSICSNFDTLKDVLSFSSTSSVLRDSCSESSAWRTLCERRWGPTALHPHLFTAAAPNERCDYKSLFLGVNGWRRPSKDIHWTSGLPIQEHPRHQKRAITRFRPAAAISCSSGPLSLGGHLLACTMSSNHAISLVELASTKRRKLSSRNKKKENDDDDDDEKSLKTPPESTFSSSTVVSSYQSQVMPFYSTSASPCSIKCLDYAQGIVACGDVRGSLHIVHLPKPQPSPSLSSTSSAAFHNDGDADEDEEEEELEVDAFIAPVTQQYPITCLEYHRPSSRLFALWDRGECGQWVPYENGCVRIFDVAQQQLLSSLKEILDSYDLCTILCPTSSSPSSSSFSSSFSFSRNFDGATTDDIPTESGSTGGEFLFQGGEEEQDSSGGNELIAGTVKIAQDRSIDGTCPRCHPHVPASLCWHQNRSSNAALAFFDLRAGEAPGRMVNRHPLPHRSLYPRLQILRENYILCSHAGDPLVIWDRRFLDGGPVSTPQLVLDNYTYDKTMASGTKNKVEENGGGGSRDFSEKIDIPERMSNALYLSCYGSMLAGRADNGDIGVWDLSNVLGWWNKNINNNSSGNGGGGVGYDNVDDDGDIITTMTRLDLEQVETGSNLDISSQWKKPVLSTYVPMASSTIPGTYWSDGLVVSDRSEVWIGSDWLAASGHGRLHYFHL